MKRRDFVKMTVAGAAVLPFASCQTAAAVFPGKAAASSSGRRPRPNPR